ncbi:MAG: family 20 glycosylhydrolase, partial [Bacteroidales bacterium]|nr:family 20 glycosylhydrolase [Bacteroidales bacterium]
MAATAYAIREIKDTVLDRKSDTHSTAAVTVVSRKAKIIISLLPSRGDYARTTLDQLLKLGDGSVPCCRIIDWPEFRWRGFMNDCGHNYLEMEGVKAILDVMALYKM